VDVLGCLARGPAAGLISGDTRDKRSLANIHQRGQGEATNLAYLLLGLPKVGPDPPLRFMPERKGLWERRQVKS
jgi:hypothetical protein